MRRTERGQDDNRYPRQSSGNESGDGWRCDSLALEPSARRPRGFAGRPDHLVDPELPNQGAGDILV